MEHQFNIIFVTGNLLILHESLVCAFGKMKFKVRIIEEMAHYGIKNYAVTDEETDYDLRYIV